MKPRIAGIGLVVPAAGAVVGSVALSLVILHSPSLTLLPGTAPADRGHVTALVLPAPHVSAPPAGSQHAVVPHPAASEVAQAFAPPKASRSATPTTPARRPTPPPPPVQTTPTPTTPTQPTVPTPVLTPTTATNNGRWSAPETKTWKAGAAKQNGRTEKGKPPWAGPKKSEPPAAATPATPAPTPATPTPPAGAPDNSNTPPGQAKIPPGQAKKA